MLYQIKDGTVSAGGHTILSHIEFYIKEKEKSLTNFLLSSKIKIMQEIRQLRMQLPDFEILCAVWHSKSRYLQAGGLDYGYDDDAKNSGCSSRQ